MASPEATDAELAERPPIAHFPAVLRSRAAVVLGCHGIPDRCVVVAGRRTPICARCLGFVGGNLFAAASFLVVGLPTPHWTLAGAALLSPAFADATAQALTSYRSTNPRRLATGLLAGYGQIVLLAGFFAHAAPRIARALTG